MMRARAACVAVCLVLCSGPLWAAEPEAGTKTILQTNSFFRCHFTWQTEQVRRESGELQFVRVIPRWGREPALAEAKKVVSTPTPPETWAAVGFDDHTWPRVRGPFFTRRTRELALLCLRARFRVDDPTRAGGLALSLVFRGGAAVYVNGKELARSHLPDGALAPLAPAEDYPKEAYVDPDGYLLRWVGFGDPKKYGKRFARRARLLENVRVPASALRKGVNVLAIELHRAPAAEILYTGKPRQHSRGYTVWSMLGLEQLRLAASKDAAVVPNTKRAKGTRLWTHPVAVSLHGPDFGDPAEPLQPLRICSPRNGVASAQLVVESDRPLRGLRAEATPLKGAGDAALPAAALQIRYARPGTHGERSGERRYPHSGGTEPRYSGGARRFDALAEAPPGEVPADPATDGAVLPVWITARVPRDARPGLYAGTVSVRRADGDPLEAPVKLFVMDWALPDPHEFVTHVGLVQSPETLAIRYSVPMWSDRHWELIDRSFRYLGELGCKVVYLPVIRRTYFGNEHAMVRWIRKDDGTFDHDFRIVERYIATAVKHLKTPPVVCVYCWEVSTGSTYMSGKHHHVENTGMPYTVLDPKTGKLTAATGPTWGSKEIRDFWQPVFNGIRAILRKHGLESSMAVGICGDRRAHEDAVKDLRAVAPDAGWVVASHNMPDVIHGQPVAYGTGVWGLAPGPDPSVKRYYGWQSSKRRAVFPRYGAGVIGHSLRTGSALPVYRGSTEAAMTGARGRLRGVGRCGADFWPVLKVRHRTRPVCGRYPETSGWHGGWLKNSFPYLLAPGPDGPLATVRFEVFREGVQETEARVALEKLLTDAAARKRLGAARAGRYQLVLDRRMRAYRRAVAGGGTYLTWMEYAGGTGWQERSWDLYAAAAEATGGAAPADKEKTAFFELNGD
jgi:hypothetical protein